MNEYQVCPKCLGAGKIWQGDPLPVAPAQSAMSGSGENVELFKADAEDIITYLHKGYIDWAHTNVPECDGEGAQEVLDATIAILRRNVDLSRPLPDTERVTEEEMKAEASLRYFDRPNKVKNPQAYHGFISGVKWALRRPQKGENG